MQDYQENRLWLFELIGWWEGAVNSTTICNQFDVSVSQSKNDLSTYRNLAPDNFYYSASLKAFIPNRQFQFKFITGDVNEYLDWMHLETKPVKPSLQKLKLHALVIPSRKVMAPIIRVLVAALRQQRKVDVDYVSVTNPDRQGRNIVPHHFVKTGLRWHLRAYCEKTKSYRDFVLSRFRGEPELLGKSEHGLENDDGWNTFLTITLKPEPRLPIEKQEVISSDYSMQNGLLHLKTRACLAQYLLQEMQINTRKIEISPEAQQLVIVNEDEVRPWLFDDKV